MSNNQFIVVGFFTEGNEPWARSVSADTPYKAIDLAIEPLKGTGTDLVLVGVIDFASGELFPPQDDGQVALAACWQNTDRDEVE